MHTLVTILTIYNVIIHVVLWDAVVAIYRVVVQGSDVVTLVIFPVLQMTHGVYYVWKVYSHDESNN